MNFGKTYAEAAEAAEAWKPRFAYVPTQMFDGSWLWWTTYFVRTSTASPNGGPGYFLRPIVQRFATIPAPRAWSPPPPKPKG